MITPISASAPMTAFVLERLNAHETKQHQVADDDAAHEFTQDRGLSNPFEEFAAKLRQQLTWQASPTSTIGSRP